MNRRKERNKAKFKKMRMLMAGMAVCSVIATNVTASDVFAYDRADAVDYADKYWNTENSDYASFNNDCTNYASQVLEAGGYSVKAIPSADVSYFDLDTTYKTTTYWCNKEYTKKFAGVIKDTGYVTTTTWNNVDQLAGSSFYGLQDYMMSVLGKTRYSWGISKSSIDKLAAKAQKGDIIQIAKAGSRFSHTYVVGKVKNGKVYVYSHTGNRDASSDDELQEMRKQGVFDNYALVALIKA